MISLMALRASIGWKYVGVEVRQHAPDDLSADIARKGVGHVQPLLLDDDHYYWVSHGYYVPHYESHKGREQFRDFERMITELTDRFFRNAQPEINRQYTHEEISTLDAMYAKALKEEAPESTKQTLGSRLVGAMINRMGRLANAIIEQRRNGHAPDILEIGDMDINAMEAQLSRYFKRLMQDTELVSQVRRNQGARFLAIDVDSGPQSPRFDHDGVLHEMIQEVGKASAFKPDHHEAGQASPNPMPTDKEEQKLTAAETRITQGRVEKIGKAMQCVDDITRLLDKMIQKDPQLSQTPTGTLLKDMGEAAKALLGVKKNDLNDYMEAEVLYESRKKDLNSIYFGSTEQATGVTIRTRALVYQGFELIKDMVTTRLACNEIYWPVCCEPSRVQKHDEVSTKSAYGDPRSRMARFAADAEAQLAKLENHKWSERYGGSPQSLQR